MQASSMQRSGLQMEIDPLLGVQRGELPRKRGWQRKVVVAALVAVGLLATMLAVLTFPHMFPNHNKAAHIPGFGGSAAQSHARRKAARSEAQKADLSQGMAAQLDDKDLDFMADAAGSTEVPVDYDSEALADEIIDLPGLEDDINFRHFAGYLSLYNTSREIFYWFVESQGNPTTDPLIFWTNGGPGCSGLLGLLSEHGPYWADPDGDLYINKFSWNKYANIVYLEQPYGVGFSEVAEEDVPVVGDQKASQDFNLIVRAFLEKFDDFQSNKVIISSESWGGHYMPQSATTIVEGNANGDQPHVNFVGYLVGNPYNEEFENTWGFMQALYGHGMIEDGVMALFTENCKHIGDLAENPVCDETYYAAYEKLGDIDFYALDFPKCREGSESTIHASIIKRKLERLVAHKDVSPEKKAHYQAGLKRINAHLEGKLQTPVIKKHAETSGDTDAEMPYWACAEDYITAYLNREDVQEAIHAKDMPYAWDECSSAVHKAWPDSDWFYGQQETIQNLVDNYDLLLMTFSGDDDSVCSTQGTMYWMYKMGWYVGEDNDFEPWYDEKTQVGGHQTLFKADENSDKVAMHFYTVRSAGHMVPQTQPRRGLEILEKYLELLEES